MSEGQNPWALIVEDLSAAHRELTEAWHAVDELRRATRLAEEAVDEVAQLAEQSRTASDRFTGQVLAVSAAAEVDTLRQRSARAQSLAEEAGDRFRTAGWCVESARERLDELGGQDLAGTERLDVTSFRLRVEAVSQLVALAAPMVDRARSHLSQATVAAAKLTRAADEAFPGTSGPAVEAGARPLANSVIRADQSVTDLDAVAFRATRGLTELVGQVYEVHDLAQRRMKHEQTSTIPTNSPPAAGKDLFR